MLDWLTDTIGSPGADEVVLPRVFAVERKAINRFLSGVGDVPVAITLWNGEELAPADRLPVARIRFHDRAALYRLLLHPDYEFGELYSQGRITVEGDLVALLTSTFRAQGRGEGRRFLPGRFRGTANTLASARENIHHHYDIGNEFYRLWLDEQLLYTCAYFENPDDTLEAAQQAKMDHVCRKLRLRAGQHVVEAGCGWGSLALHMARHYGVRVRAYNIAHEQVKLARERAKNEGLAERVEFIEDDYRNISGIYDAFVSVGMLEHVGPAHFGELGDVIDRCLEREGCGLIHTIGRDRAMPVNPWIARRIFPGGVPPSLKEMMDIFEPHLYSVLDVENLRLHYAITLRHWLERFEAHEATITGMLDERFVRMWRLYLAGSKAAFLSGCMQLFQVVFTRATNNDVPLTRAHLYRLSDEGTTCRGSTY
jgi:cyclopropane-fatty-acyl-phospholipid synthase